MSNKQVRAENTKLKQDLSSVRAERDELRSATKAQFQQIMDLRGDCRQLAEQRDAWREAAERYFKVRRLPGDLEGSCRAYAAYQRARKLQAIAAMLDEMLSEGEGEG